jgi:uncharacterized Fe-S cluster-containing radical SAM superfamily protein
MIDGLPMLVLPTSLNYIGAFLTMDCNLNCSYCINDPEQAGDRRAIFHDSKTLNPSDWVQIFNRIPVRDDLPITLQGGEPTMYAKGKGIGQIVDHCDHWFDLLTNLSQTPENFIRNLNGNELAFQRGKIMNLPYQSIRVSYHADEMNRTWKNGIDELVRRCEALREYGFQVSADKSKTDVCIYMVAHPSNKLPEINGDIYFESKPFLGVHDGKLYGDYAYPHSTDLIERDIWPVTLNCECRTSELLIDPLGQVFQCHAYLYNHWLGKKEFQPIGSMLDPKFTLESLKHFRECSHYGACIPCDTKRKNNRFQSLMFNGIEHVSCEIKNIKWPEKFK